MQDSTINDLNEIDHENLIKPILKLEDLIESKKLED